jgi:hypothetical protein
LPAFAGFEGRHGIGDGRLLDEHEAGFEELAVLAFGEAVRRFGTTFAEEERAEEEAAGLEERGDAGDELRPARGRQGVEEDALVDDVELRRIEGVVREVGAVDLLGEARLARRFTFSMAGGLTSSAVVFQPEPENEKISWPRPQPGMRMWRRRG